MWLLGAPLDRLVRRFYDILSESIDLGVTPLKDVPTKGDASRADAQADKLPRKASSAASVASAATVVDSSSVEATASAAATVATPTHLRKSKRTVFQSPPSPEYYTYRARWSMGDDCQEKEEGAVEPVEDEAVKGRHTVFQSPPARPYE